MKVLCELAGDMMDDIRQKDVEIAQLHEHYRLEIRRVGDEGKLKRKEMTLLFGKETQKLQKRLDRLIDFRKRQVKAL